LENAIEEGKMPKKDAREVLARAGDTAQRENPAFSLEDFESGKTAVNPDWVKEVWRKWPGGESIEELLAALDGHSLEKKSIDGE
jgi:hypothetical protein